MAGPWEKYQNPSWQYQSGPDPVRMEEIQRKREDQDRQSRAEQRAIEASNRAADAASRQAQSDAMTAQVKALEIEAKKAEAAATSGQKSPDEMANMRAEALSKIKIARSLAKRSQEQWFSTGFGSGIAGGVRGTNAYDVAQDTETVKNAGGLQRIMEMSKANGGKNPLTPLSNTDFQALINSLTALDTGQSDDQFQANLGEIESLYRRLYKQSGGGDIDQELKALGADDATGPMLQRIPDLANRPLPAAGATPQGMGPGGMHSGGGIQPGGNGRVQTSPMMSVDARYDTTVATGPTATVEAPKELQQAAMQWISQNMGNLTPQTYASTLNALAESYGYPGRVDPNNPNVQTEVIQLNTGKASYGGFAPAERPTTGTERVMGSLLTNPVGAGAASYLNAAGLGIPSLANQTAFEGIRKASPVGAFIGDVGGAITGSGAIGKVGSKIAGRIAPRLLGGGKAAALGRQVAQDAAYGGAYGGVTEGDPLGGAIAGAAGSVVGQGIGRGIGKVMTGGGSMAAKVLRAKGVPLTVGQAVSDSGVIGRSIKGIEDRLAGFPVIGDVVNARRMEGLSGFNNAAFNEGVAPIGGSINRVGPAGVEDAFALGSNAYDNAVKGVDLTLTPQFGADLGNAMAKGQNLPGQMADEFAWTMQNRVRPEVGTGSMTGEGYQSIMQGLRRDRAAMKGQPRGLDFADSVRGVEGVTTDFMRNNGGANVVSGLNTADKAWRNIKVLQDAVDKAKNAEELFTPAQLNQAASASAKKFGGSHGTTNRPFYALGRAAQKVLPSKIPDSGTAGRLALMALPATMGGTGAGLGYASGDAQGGAATGIGAGMALAALGTKAGQKLLVKAIMDRPASVRSIGRKIRKGKGLLGSAAVPLFLPSGE